MPRTGGARIAKLHQRAGTSTRGSMLRFVDADEPGYTRRRCGKGWRYFDADGQPLTDRAEIERLNAIALPPAYRNAWYAADANAHILATGIDARGRKQYRYHPDFRRERDLLKFDKCANFGRSLPVLRAQVARDLEQRRLTRDRAIACVIRLLDGGSIRVGSERYARANRSFGATTLRARHLQLDRNRAELKFRAKSGKLRRLPLTDRALIRFVRKAQSLPGQHLFQYVEDGVPSAVTSQDVNAYIADAIGGDFTAKDFRTWAASVIAFEHLRSNPVSTLKAMLGQVADALGNTPTISRKYYVHPLLIDSVAAKGGAIDIAAIQLPRRTRWLSRAERALIALLEQQGASLEQAA